VRETIRRLLLTTSASTATTTCRRGGAQEGRGRTVTRIALVARRRWLRNGEIPQIEWGRTVAVEPRPRRPPRVHRPTSRRPTIQPPTSASAARTTATAHVAWWATPAFSPRRQRPGPEPAGVAVRALHWARPVDRGRKRRRGVGSDRWRQLGAPCPSDEAGHDLAAEDLHV